MPLYSVIFTRQAKKDRDRRILRGTALDKNLKKQINILGRDPYEFGCEKLSGKLKGFYSRRLNDEHRIVYEVDDEAKVVKIIQVWSHYER